MKTISDIIFEAKFSNFTPVELAAFKDQLEELRKNDKFLNSIALSRSRSRINPPLDSWAKVHQIPKSDKIEYGKKYLLVFDNPFATGRQLTPKSDNGLMVYPEPCEKDENTKVMCIGIADKFGKLHLVNQWEPECTVQWRDKGLYMKTTTTVKNVKISDLGGKWRNEDIESLTTFYSEKGWYLLRKNYPCYYVSQDVHKSGVNDFWYVYPEKQQNAFVRLEDCVILDISMLPAKFEEMQKEIERRAKEHERFKKAEEARLKAEEERKKWWKEREDYEDLGCSNGWTETPEIVKKAYDDKEAKWYEVNLGRCYNRYFCDKYKITYTVDSSD